MREHWHYLPDFKAKVIAYSSSLLPDISFWTKTILFIDVSILSKIKVINLNFSLRQTSIPKTFTVGGSI